jgi:hypothetical protein
MKRLEELILYETQLDRRGVEHLSKLRNLVERSLRGGSYRDDWMAPLGSLAKLRKLSLADLTTINGTFAAHLAGLPRLRKLDLELIETVTDDGLASMALLSKREVLYVGGPFTDVGLLQLRALKHLQTQGISSPHVTHVGVSFVAELPQLNSLYLDTPLLTDDAILSLLRCSALERIRFAKPCLTGAGLQHLRDALPHCSVEDDHRDRYEHEPDDEEQNNRPRFESETSFEILLAKASDWDLVNATFSKISDRYSHWVDAGAYSPVERVIMLVWHATGIIGNGGFEYFFAGEFPGDPDFHITADACKAAGLVRSYEAFQEAFSLFPGGGVPHDPEQRWRLYDEANRSARDCINRKLWRDGYDHLCEKKLAEFIRKHANELSYLDSPS